MYTNYYVYKGPAFFEDINLCEFPRVQTCPSWVNLEYRCPKQVGQCIWISVKLLEWIFLH